MLSNLLYMTQLNLNVVKTDAMRLRAYTDSDDPD